MFRHWTLVQGLGSNELGSDRVGEVQIGHESKDFRKLRT